MSSDRAITISVDGVNRRFLLHAPDAAIRNSPLVVMIHGKGGFPEWAADETDWSAYADRLGFVVAYPEALPLDPQKPAKFLTNPRTWHDGSRSASSDADRIADRKFISAMLDVIIRDNSVDPNRIYVTGFSNGAGMTFALAAASSDRLAAIAPVAGHCWVENPTPTRKVPTFYLVGAADPLVPLPGGITRNPWGQSRRLPSVADTLSKWADALDCQKIPHLVNKNETFVLESFRADSDDDRLLAMTIAGLGHHWPGGRGQLSSAIAGRRTTGVNACEEIWTFFQRHCLK